MASGTSKVHKTFKRSYREDYRRDLEVPGIGHHVFQAFKMIFENWKIFLPLLIIMVLAAVFLMGMVNESSFKDVAIDVFAIIIFLVIWLVTIFVLRHKMAGHKIGLRDALYNALTPLLSSLVVLVVAIIQSIPLMILVIAYSAAVETHFLETPFYALMFLVFAGLMILLSMYLLTGTLMAFVAVSAPGLYPYEALQTANELMRGRKIRFVLRIIALLVVLGVIWAIIIWPMAMWAAGTPVLSVCLTVVGCFSAIYMASYFYIYYRYMLKFDTKEEKNGQKRSRKKN